MTENFDNLYSDEFYSRNEEGMKNSAQTILGLLFQHFIPNSVIDIGCGQGAWLAAAEKLGTRKLIGMDGEWIRDTKLISKNIDFRPINFDNAMPKISEKYDLCISLEVAEHLSKVNAKPFIDLLCDVSDIVLFSAAIPNQGGTNHINEQWPSYWIELFGINEYKCIDILRQQIWNDDSIEWWYRQNILLFVGQNCDHIEFHEQRNREQWMNDVVHPIHYEQTIAKFRSRLANPSGRLILGCIKRFIQSKLRINRSL